MDNKAPVSGMLDDGQLAKAIYLRNMSAMKEVLNMGEFKIGGGNRESKDYKYFKKIVMDQFYNSMTDLFSSLEKHGLLRKCPCGTGIRDGFKPCPLCNGAGHCNVEEFSDWFASDQEQPQ